MQITTFRTTRIFGLCIAAYFVASSGALAGTISYAQPTISTFTPTSGPVGTVITVSGAGFTGLNAAWIGTTHNPSVSVVSDTQVKITVPSDVTSGQVAVLNPQHAAFSPASFVVTKGSDDAQPTISTFTPSGGTVGTVITVSGTGFTGLTSAWIGTVRDASVSVVSDTQARITVPGDATGGQVAVFNSQHAAFSPASFNVTKPIGYSQPTIATFALTSGPVGTVITVSGKGFTGLNAAWIGTAHDAASTVISDSQVKVTVPSDGVTGQITLLNPQHSASSSGTFTVTRPVAYARPTVSTFTPASGPVGTVITVSGRGFTGLNAAWIGAAHDAASTVISDSQVKVTVPNDGGTGQITLLNPQYSASSSGSFTVTPPVNPGTMSLRVSGAHFIDIDGLPVQLRGVNTSGLEFVAVQGWNPADPWGGLSPNFAAIKTWKSNTVRFPLNEASWLGYPCVDGNGVTRDPDPGHNYQETVKKAVADATAAGLYVILGLHWNAPKNFCPLAQNPMADADNSVNFWISIANTFKNSHNVVFSLLNEPYLYWLANGEVDWDVLMHGGTETQFVTGTNGAPFTANYTWKTAGMQAMIDAIRATGATNVLAVAGVSWGQDLSQWAAHAPNDPLKQVAAVWHAYPNSGTVGDPGASVPKFGVIAYTWTQSVLDAGYPVVITEFGDHNAPGTVGAPFVSHLLPWSDARDVSYIGWVWDPWQDHDNVLIKDVAGTPTDGYGVYTRAHYLCVAAGSSNCP